MVEAPPGERAGVHELPKDRRRKRQVGNPEDIGKRSL